VGTWAPPDNKNTEVTRKKLGQHHLAQIKKKKRLRSLHCDGTDVKRARPAVLIGGKLVVLAKVIGTLSKEDYKKKRGTAKGLKGGTRCVTSLRSVGIRNLNSQTAA